MPDPCSLSLSALVPLDVTWKLEQLIYHNHRAACILISGKGSGYMGIRQRLWLEAMQTRITTTVAAIGTMKGVKATGSTDILNSVITKLRTFEIQRSIKFREILVMLVTLCRLRISPLASLDPF